MIGLEMVLKRSVNSGKRHSEVEASNTSPTICTSIHRTMLEMRFSTEVFHSKHSA